MRNAGKLVWTLFLVQCAAVALLFGGYWGSKANIKELTLRTQALEQRLAAAEQALKDRLQPVAPQPTEPPASAAPDQTGQPPTQAQPTNKVEPSSSAEHVQPATTNPADTVVCVDKNTHTVFACDQAVNCVGPKGFDTAYFNGLRTKLGITNAMMICSVKSAEAASAPASAE